MATDEQTRQQRADRLREQIKKLQADVSAPAEADAEEMRPDESPKEYVERRARELARQKPPPA